MSLTTGSTATLKVANRQLIMKILMEEAPLTKQEISRLTNLAFSTVSNLVMEMQGENIIKEMGLAESGGGRRATLYQLNPHSRLYIGVDIQVDKLIIVILGSDSSIIASHQESIESALIPTETAKLVHSRIQELSRAHGFSYELIGGIGVSIPGPINTKEQMVLSPPNMRGWRNVPFRDMMQNVSGVPCLIEKDANAAAYGESKSGVGRGVNNLLYVFSDIGIGGGIVINGDVYRGSFDDAGDIGHMPIDMTGRRCNCGGTGCLETVASGLAIERMAQEFLGEELRVEDILQQCDTNPKLTQIVSTAGKYLGYALGGLFNALNCDEIILGGRLMDKSELYFNSVINSMRTQILPEFLHRVRIERSKFGHLAGAVGAGMLIVHKMLLSPELPIT